VGEGAGFLTCQGCEAFRVGELAKQRGGTKNKESGTVSDSNVRFQHLKDEKKGTKIRTFRKFDL